MADAKKILFVATVVKTHIMVFHIPFLEMCKKMGWKTAVAAKNDYENPDDCIIPFCDEFTIHRMRMRFGVYNVRPGITGLAQLSGRDLVMPAQKVRMDLQYLENYGLRQDVKLVLLTIPKALGHVGIVEGEESRKVAESERD